MQPIHFNDIAEPRVHERASAVHVYRNGASSPNATTIARIFVAFSK